MTRMILSILKYDGSVPSIRRCILEAMGQDYDEIVTQSKNTSILDQCESKAFAMVSDLLMSNHIHKKMVSAQFNGLDWQHPKMIKLRTLLTWIKDKLYPDLLKTSREILQIAKAMDKQYISPGPGGALTRGKTDILPTGRNIYSIDPRKIPTKTAYKIGVRLADEILNKSLAEENAYPEKLGWFSGVWMHIVRTENNWLRCCT